MSVRVIDVITGEETTREYTTEEIHNIEISSANQLDLPHLTLDQRKIAMKIALKEYGAARIATGFPYDFGGEYGIKTLQLRPGTDDRLNWTNAMVGYQLQVGIGNGDVQNAYIRTEDNTTVQITYSQALYALAAMLEWGNTHYRVVWDKKDAIERANDLQELKSIIIDGGWPE